MPCLPCQSRARARVVETFGVASMLLNRMVPLNCVGVALWDIVKRGYYIKANSWLFYARLSHAFM